MYIYEQQATAISLACRRYIFMYVHAVCRLLLTFTPRAYMKSGNVGHILP